MYQRTPKEKRDEIVAAYLTGENSYEELGKYYGVAPQLITVWVSRYRKGKNVVSLQPESKPVEDMARKKKESEKSPEVGLAVAVRPFTRRRRTMRRSWHARSVSLMPCRRSVGLTRASAE